MQYELAFIGAGNMAEAIARAAIDQRVLDPKQMVASDPSEQRRAALMQLGIEAHSDNATVIGQSKQVLLAVKPQVLAQAAADLGQYGSTQQVILSIMAGISTGQLGQAIAGQHVIDQPRIIRIMPNTPLQVGFGMTGIALGPHARDGDQNLAMRLFGAAGQVILVDESKLDAITAISGSGPAYVFYLAEAMHRAAVELGLAQHADILVQQTILGAAHLMVSSQDSPAALRQKVTSPGGTTQAAINHLETRKTCEEIVRAIRIAAQRSMDLSTIGP